MPPLTSQQQSKGAHLLAQGIQPEKFKEVQMQQVFQCVCVHMYIYICKYECIYVYIVTCIVIVAALRECF